MEMQRAWQVQARRTWGAPEWASNHERIQSMDATLKKAMAPVYTGWGPGVGTRGVQKEVTGVVRKLVVRAPPAGWVVRKAFHRRMEGAEHR